MNPKEKQRLLTREFAKILEKSYKICTECNAEFIKIRDVSEHPSTDIDEIIRRNLVLFQIIVEVQNNLSQKSYFNPKNVADIKFDDINEIIRNFKSRFKQELLDSEENNQDKKTHQNKDVVSAKLSVLERIEMEVTRVLRSFFQIVEKIYMGKNNEVNLGETPFALRLAGQSQFFSRPMTSLKDVELALDDISTRLHECIVSNQQDDNETRGNNMRL